MKDCKCCSSTQYISTKAWNNEVVSWKIFLTWWPCIIYTVTQNNFMALSTSTSQFGKRNIHIILSTFIDSHLSTLVRASKSISTSVNINFRLNKISSFPTIQLNYTKFHLKFMKILINEFLYFIFVTLCHHKY